MRKVAIFIEGQTEQIFVTKLLYEIYGYDKIEILSEKIRITKCFVQLKAKKTDLTYYFLIVDICTSPEVKLKRFYREASIIEMILLLFAQLEKSFFQSLFYFGSIRRKENKNV